jgi:phage-related protein
MREALKPVEWMGDSLERVRSFSRSVRQQVGFELEMVQHGLEPSDWKPMPIVGPGVSEIRVHVEGEYRVLWNPENSTRHRPSSASPRLVIKRCFEWRV